MDQGICALSSKHNFKIYLLDLTTVLQEIVTLQKTNALATIVLGKLVLGNTLLALSLKNGETLTTIVNSDHSKTGKIIAEFQNDAVRAYIQKPNFPLSESDFLKITKFHEWVNGKNGELTIVRQSSNSTIYTSKIALSDQGSDYDFMTYGWQSNQIHNLIITGLTLQKEGQINRAVGLYIELFPQHTEADLQYLEAKIAKIAIIRQQLLQTEDLINFLKQLIPDALVLKERNFSFQCGCNRKKALAALKLWGLEEIEAMIKENKPIEIICDFCKRKQIFAITALDELRKSMIE